MSKTVQDILNELPPDKYRELLGIKSANPLNEAFEKGVRTTRVPAAV